MDDILTRVYQAPPVDTRYVAGRWHRDRLTWRGVWVEARVWAASLRPERNRDVRKFLILGRARSGTTLLTGLLNAHPEVTCDREVLAKSVLAPAAYLDRLAAKSATAAYGAKLLSYQMAQVQRLRDPVGFLHGLQDRGFRFVHIERESFPQLVSLMVAKSRRIFHRSRTDAPTPRLEVDVDDVVRQLDWTEMLLDYERRCLRDLPHAHVSYEDDLRDPGRHQATADRLFEWIGVPPAPVAAGVRKLLPEDPRGLIANYAELERAMRAAGHARLLPD
jgi:hypothetical protein